MATTRRIPESYDIATENNDVLFTSSSEQLKSAVRRFGERNERPNYGNHNRSKTNQCLRLAHAQSVVSVAQQCTTVRRDQEDYILRNLFRPEIAMDGSASAFNVARAARNTLQAEADLILSRFRECQLQLVVLEHAFKEAQACLKEADDQVDNITEYLARQNRPPPPAIDYSVLSATVMASYESHIRAWLPINWLAGAVDLKTCSRCGTLVKDGS
ncbi:hypothetical protein GALMADRAFT_143899 [Galerina marginata CBS 339.88]|uniref:Uncharacterized protein n=1 Tax=Galerina marginata (strain CBS 339.88) TaxID=685588 RepID=A0A067SNM8_GALM3|nr:hypothetical protein GALMADRAFT_143899 [Galerina marginata CBS 339.88]